MAIEILKSILPIFGAILVTLFSYEYIEVRRKRKIETYWRIEGEYKSDTQQNARKFIEKVDEAFKEKKNSLSHSSPKDLLDKLTKFYNAEFHESPDQDKKNLAWTIRTRLRFLHLIGVLLKKKMIDQDLLFSLIGLGLEIDYETLSIIVNAHRRSHNTPYLYNHFEFLWSEYQNWKSNLSATV